MILMRFIIKIPLVETLGPSSLTVELPFAWNILSWIVVSIITFLVAQTVKRLSTMQETWVRSLGQEDSLEKEMATHSSTLALKIPRMEELGTAYYPWGRKESGTTEWLHFHFLSLSVRIGIQSCPIANETKGQFCWEDGGRGFHERSSLDKETDTKINCIFFS